MNYFPVFLDAKHLRCLVVGAGEVGARKLELILKTPAKITVVSPELVPTVQELVHKNNLTLHRRCFEPKDLDGVNMVFVATDDEAVNQQVHDLATERGILVNVVDNTPLCKFITPSIVDRSPIIIAMSSGGVAPVLLRYLRQKLESVIPQQVSKLGEFSERFRDKVKHTLQSVTTRRYFWEDVLDGDIGEAVVKGQNEKAETKFHEALEAAAADKQTQGEVYLVGAGPGDPDLLTFRALRLMQKSRCSGIRQACFPQPFLEMVRRDAEKIYVGKEKSKHTLPQDQINNFNGGRGLKRQ